ncbi:MAG: replication-relaxation family protein [Solirubrobacterales bacterium]|nr:replication-relaxation family protein [Solirubrobacterales bacterium]
MSAPGKAAREVTGIGSTILESVGQHRLLLGRQIGELHTPGASRRWTHQKLALLRAAGLATGTAGPGSQLLWHLTERGADTLDGIPSRAETRRKVIAPEQAAGPLREHTIGVNEIGLAFVRAARERGDECGPFDWFHEVAHSLGPPPGRRMPEQLISDAVLTYQFAEQDGSTSIAYRFVELDRANRSVADLARRLGRYARFYRRRVAAEEPQAEAVPLWERLYPVFPTVLVVLDGRRPDRLEDRRRTLLALCGQDPDLLDSPEVEVSVCLLDDLIERGPFAPICRTLADPDRDADWLGDS